MNRIEKSIIASFTNVKEQSFSQIVAHTNIPKGTVKKYLVILLKKEMLEAIGEGRGRYYQQANHAQTNQVSVFKSAVLIGFLEHEVGRYIFEYDKGYKGKKLDGLTENSVIISASLFPIFENLIPESDRRNAYLSEDKNLVEILLSLHNTHGDFDFIPTDKLHAYKANYTQRKNWVLVKEKILETQEFVNILSPLSVKCVGVLGFESVAFV